MIRLRDLSPATQRLVRGQAQGKSLGRMRGGARAARAGRELEEEILRIAARSIQVQLEQLPKCGARFVGRGRTHVLPICCDFVGAFDPGGRALFFDAKRAGEDEGAMALGNPKIVKPHQAAFLNRMDRAGAVAGLLVRHGNEWLWLRGLHLLGGDRVKWNDARWMAVGAETILFSVLLAMYRS